MAVRLVSATRTESIICEGCSVVTEMDMGALTLGPAVLFRTPTGIVAFDGPESPLHACESVAREDLAASVRAAGVFFGGVS